MDSAECTQVIANIRENFKAYMTHSKLKSIVIGISGGIDSSICAALLRPVCDELSTPLIGVSLPSGSNKSEECDRADLIGEAFCSKYDIQPIDGVADALYESIGEIVSEWKFNWDEMPERRFKIGLGNIKARTRMIHLYQIAFIYEGMVISTDNYTELMLGFWTLHGDVGDYGPIQSLWKTEVYEISRSLAISLTMEGKDKQADALIACVNAIPTDGLGITSSDLEQIGASSYAEVDTILKGIVESGPVGYGSETYMKVRDRHLASQFKRQNPYNIPRNLLFR